MFILTCRLKAAAHFWDAYAIFTNVLDDLTAYGFTET